MTKIERIDGQWHKTNGTHLQGHLNASYEEIVSVLGQPTHAVETTSPNCLTFLSSMIKKKLLLTADL